MLLTNSKQIKRTTNNKPPKINKQNAVLKNPSNLFPLDSFQHVITEVPKPNNAKTGDEFIDNCPVFNR